MSGATVVHPGDSEAVPWYSSPAVPELVWSNYMAPRNGSAREQARKLQQEQERKHKTQSLLLRIGVVVVSLVVVGALVFFAVLRPDDNESYTAGPAPSAANEQGGISLSSTSELEEGDSLGEIDAENLDDAKISGSGEQPPGVEPREEGEVPHVVMYTDAGCPACGQFEAAYHSMLTEWIDAGAITMEVRSVTWVSPPYSSQTANAFACMAEESPENYFSYFGEITSVRGEGGEFSNDEMAALAQDSYGTDISECISDGTYRAFSQYTSNLASENGVRATPTIYVDDQEVPEFMNAGDVILEAVQAYQEETGDEVIQGVDEALQDAESGEEPTDAES